MVSLSAGSNWLLQGFFVLGSIPLNLSSVLLDDHGIVKRLLTWRIVSKACDVGNHRLGEFILPDFSRPRLQILNDLRALSINSSLFHPAYMSLNLNICEEVLLAVHLVNCFCSLLAYWSWFRLNVIRVILVLKIAMALIFRKRLRLCLDSLISGVLSLEIIGILSLSTSCTKNLSFPFFRLECAILQLCCLKAFSHLCDLLLPFLVPEHVFLINRRFSSKIGFWLASSLLLRPFHMLLLLSLLN